MFGRYRIEQVVGRGGMGVVVRATDTELQRTVALKFVAPELADDPVIRERFMREARLAAAIEHPNIVPIHEAGERDGTLFLAMRAIPGPDLATVLRREAPLDPARTLAIVTPLADALDAAHRRGLVHRDVKPGNVLLEPGEDGAPERPWLTDFGLTRRLSDATVTVDGPLGTIDYLAPELVDGQAIGPWTDQYSLACLVVHCLTGAPPWQGPTDAAVLYAHVHGDRTALAGRVPDPAVAAVLARALAPDGHDRFPDCRSMVAALAVAMGRGPTTGVGAATGAATGATEVAVAAPSGGGGSTTRVGPPAPSVQQGGGGRPRRRIGRGGVVVAVGLVALLGAGALLATSGALVQAPGPSSGPSSDPDPAAVSPGAATPRPRAGMGGVIVFAGGSGDELDLWAVRPDDSGLRRLTSDPGTERYPTVTPDGRAVIYNAGPVGSRDLWLLPLDGGRPQRLTRNPADDYAPAISPDGTRLLWTSNRDGDLDIWMAEDEGDGFAAATPVNLTAARGTDTNHDDIFPAWAPDGGGFAFASNRAASADIWWLDPDRPGDPRPLTSDGPDFIDMSPTVAPDDSVVFVGRRAHLDRELYRVRAGEAAERLTELGDEVGTPAVAPDGAHLIAAVGTFDDATLPVATRLLIMGANGGRQGVIQTGHEVATDPDWAPTLFDPDATTGPAPDPSPGT